MQQRVKIVPALFAALAVVAVGLVPSATAAPKPPAAPGDFNGDGRRDLAIGSPFGEVGAQQVPAGFVTVVYADASGVNGAKRQVLSQSSTGIPGGSEEYDQFGASLASADFDRDGYADLAVAAPGEDSPVFGGRVTLIYGSQTGLSSRARIIEVAAAAVTAGDFDRNGTPDLAVGSWGRLWTYTKLAQGNVTGTQIFVGSPEFETAEVYVTAADYTGDRFADLAYSIVAPPISGDDYLTRINVYKGSATGLVKTPVYSDTANYADSMASGDVNGDGKADLVVGNRYIAGSVRFYPGTAAGVGAPRVITQETAGVPEANEPADEFGASVAVGDVNGDGRAEIAVGNPGENIGGKANSGAVTLLYGRAGGPTGQGAQLLHQDTANVPGTTERGDRFGATLAIANLLGGPRVDLAVGSPNEDNTQGVVHIFPGSPYGPVAGGMKAFYATTLGVANRNAHLGAVLLP